MPTGHQRRELHPGAAKVGRDLKQAVARAKKVATTTDVMDRTSQVSRTFGLLGRVSLTGDWDKAKAHAAREKKKLRPCPYPQKAVSKPERCERVYKRTAEAQRDFLRGGQELSSLTLSQLRGEIAWEFEKLPFCYAKPQFSRR